MKKALLSLGITSITIAGAAIASSALYQGSAQSISMAVRGMYVSQNADCSNPITVFEDASAARKDFVQSLALGGGGNDIPDGTTLNCVVLKVSDQLAVTVNTAAVGGLCSKFKGQDMYDVVNLGGDSTYRGTDLTGANLAAPVGPNSTQDDGTISGLGGLSSEGDQSIYLFFTTGTADSDIFRKPDGSGHGGIHMNSAITINGSTNLAFKLVATTNGKSIKDLQDSGTECSFYDGNWTMSIEKQ